MSSGLPTLQGTVNTTHCDEIGHMNVQFYVAAGADATRLFAAAHGMVGPVTSFCDHIRFYRELRVGDIFICHTQAILRDDKGLTLLHELGNRGTGEIAATIVTRTHFDLPTILLEDLPETAKPRSLAAASGLPCCTLQDPQTKNLIPIYQGIIHPDQCDEMGEMRQQFLTSRFSDGAAHLWHHVGFDREAMLKAQRGTVVLEMRIDRLKALRAGTPLIVKSAILQVMGKVLHFAHFMFDVHTGELVATSEAAAVLFDLSLRKTVPYSEQEIATLTPHIVKV